MGITGAFTALTTNIFSIIILIVLAILGWKIFKRAVGIFILLVIAIVILYYFGWLLPI